MHDKDWIEREIQKTLDFAKKYGLLSEGLLSILQLHHFPPKGYLPYDVPHVECHGGLSVSEFITKLQAEDILKWNELKWEHLTMVRTAN